MAMATAGAAAAAKKSGIEAWEYNPAGFDDPKLPHKHTPNRPVPLSHLHELGVLTWKLDVEDVENNSTLKQIKEERGYKYSETITVSREAMKDFDAKVEGFYTEHMHSQEEVRVILDGSGYWDIRDYDEKWVRFAVHKGDMLVLPPGMFHRFTVDHEDYIKALLIYTEVPERTQHARAGLAAEESSAARKAYVEKFLRKFSN